MELTNLEYFVGEYNEIGSTYNSNNLKSDITCKLKAIMDNDILIDIEIQINWLYNLENRLFKYDTTTENTITEIYNDVIVIVFMLDDKKSKKILLR